MRSIKFTIIGEDGIEKHIEELWEDSPPIQIPKSKIEKEIKPVIEKKVLSPSPSPKVKPKIKKILKPIIKKDYRVNKTEIPKDVKSFSKGFQLPFFR